MAVKPKDETGRDWNWARGDNAAIHNQFEINRLSARIADTLNPQTGKFGTDGVLLSHGAEYQSGLPGIGTLAEAGGDLDISTGNWCIAGWLFLRTGIFAGPVTCDLWGYSQYGIQFGTRYLNASLGSGDGAYFNGVWDAKFSLLLDTAIVADGSQTTYSLINGVWVPVTYEVLGGTVFLHAVLEASDWDSTWRHVAFARYGNELAVYFHGQKRATYNYAGALSVCNESTNKLYIGRGFVPM